MSDLQVMALERAAEDILQAGGIFAAVEAWRETPLTAAQRCEMSVEANNHLDAAWKWIKAVLNDEDDEEEGG